MTNLILALIGLALFFGGGLAVQDARVKARRRKINRLLARQASKAYYEALRSAEAAHYNATRRLR